MALVLSIGSNIIVNAEQVKENPSKPQQWQLPTNNGNILPKQNIDQGINAQQIKDQVAKKVKELWGQEAINKKIEKAKQDVLNNTKLKNELDKLQQNVTKEILKQVQEKWAQPKPTGNKAVQAPTMVQKIQQLTSEQKAQLINVAKEKVNNIKTEVKQKIENKKQEIIKDIKQELQKQKDIHIEQVKKQFETKKQEILNLAKSGKLWNEEAKKQILANRDILIEQTKANIKAWAEKLKQEKISSVKSAVKQQFETKLADVNKLPKAQQKTKYMKLDASIDKLAKTATKAQNEVYNIMREILREKINSLK